MENEKETFLEKLQRVLLPIGAKLAAQRHLGAISAGMMAAIPLTLLSAFVALIQNPPVTADLIAQGGAWSLLAPWYNFSTTYAAQIAVPYNMTIEIFALIAVFGISYTLAKSYKGMKPLNASITAVAMFLLVAAPYASTANLDMAAELGTAGGDFINSYGSAIVLLPAKYLGSTGLFAAMIVALCSVEITRWVEEKHWVIKMPDSVPPNVSEPFEAVVPTLFNLVIWYTISLLCQNFAGVTFPGLIYKVLNPVFQAALNPVTMILLMEFACLLWLFGIHGTNIIYAGIMAPMMQWAMSNASAYHTVLAETGSMEQAREALVVYPTVWMMGMAIGGTGGTLGLCILMMRSKSAQLSTIGKLAIVPGICGINEPITFGVPIVLNPIMAIPYMLTPLVCSLIGGTLTVFGVLDVGHEVVMSLLPIGVASFLTTGRLRNTLYEFVMIPVEMLIWYPFFKIQEAKLVADEQAYEEANA